MNNPENPFRGARGFIESPALAAATDHISRFYPNEHLFDHDHSERLYALRRRTPAGKLLTVLGGEHNTDPSFWHYAPAREYFHEWRQQTDGQDRIMLYEGPYSGFAATEEESIMRHYSERGLLASWSDTYDIPLVSAEPENFSDLHTLINEFPFDETLCFLGMREIPVWRRIPEAMRPPLDIYLDDILQETLGATRQAYPDIASKVCDFSYANFEHVCRPYLTTLMGREIDLTDADEAKWCLLLTTAYGNPDPDVATLPVARISVREIVLRDIHISAVFDKYRNAGKHIFSWYGQTHILALKDYLESFGDPIDELAAKGGYIMKPSRAAKTGLD